MRSIEIPQPDERDWRYRAFEILPGALTWLVLFLPLILTLIDPKLAAYFIIMFLLLWFARAVGLYVRSLQGFRIMNEHKRAPWQKLNRDLETLEIKTEKPPKWHVKNLARVKAHIPEHLRIKPSEVYHAVFVAVYNESRDTVQPTIESIAAADYDPKKIILVLAYEERGGPEVEEIIKSLAEEYEATFFHVIAAKHPKDIQGEVIGKGGNITYAAHSLKEFLETRAIEPPKVLVTTLDADNRPDKQYFGALSYTYCSTEDPKHYSYQPIPMFLNNIWDAPAPMRVIATGNSFWMVVQNMRPHILRNFSAHAQSMDALIDTDFWSTRTIVEDGHQYWRTWFRFDGRHDVIPIFTPIYQDAVLTDKYIKTLKMQFIQVRRWAWGASDVAYVAYHGFMKPNRIPRHKLWSRFLRLLEGHISWSTAPLILLTAALIPYLVNSESYLANQLPQVARWVQTIATAGVIVTLFLSMRTLPPKPARYKRRRSFWMVIQWVYLPLTTIVYSSFAAIYSQTRLMFGWYLGWVVTEKAVRK